MVAPLLLWTSRGAVEIGGGVADAASDEAALGHCRESDGIFARVAPAEFATALLFLAPFAPPAPLDGAPEGTLGSICGDVEGGATFSPCCQ
jgi:hypothetical protein